MLAMAMMLSSLPVLVSCNKDKDDDDTFSYSDSEQTTLIKAFGLQADADVLSNLDSVHFTIDYDKGMIYNADSLPKGTDITGLKVTVEFLNTVSSAIFNISGASTQADTTIEYTSSMTKKLDFSGKTVLTVTSADKSRVKDYNIQVLVHKVNPDSLAWPQQWRRDLPGYRSDAIGHKAVKQGEIYRIMVYNGQECELLSATSLSQPMWNKQTIDMPFTPQVQSLCASDDALYILADDGTLFSSADGLEWTSCGVVWHTLIGTYDGRALGITGGDGIYYHDEYPRSDGFVATEVEDGFPVAHSSGMIETDNQWTASQQAMIVGGVDSEGEVLSAVWGYDGSRWGKINNIHSGKLPALTDATLFPYYIYAEQSGVRRYSRAQTWYLMGGRLADGTLNDKIYLSSTQGITWTVGDSTIAQSPYMPAFYGAQAFVESMDMTQSNGAPRRVPSAITTWSCPFIYLFGGFNDQNQLLPNVWRGVYIRMTNYPVY